jgi:hypothetical protein
MRTTIVSLLLALSFSTTARAADVTFAFEDARWLRDGEREGGVAHLATVTAPAPLVVFLHGVNEGGPLHRGLGGGTFDVRAVVDELISDGTIDAPIVAGPSQTRDAWTGAKLWNDFDLGAFVDATEKATATKIDRSRVILVGHSGSGCNATGGLLGPMKMKPMAIVALDPCMDERFGKLWAAQTTPAFIAYQDLIWPREYAAFKTAIDVAIAKGRITLGRYNAPTLNPHEEVVRLGLRSILPKLLPPPEDED